MLLAFLLTYAVHLGIVHLLRHAVNGAAYLVLRHTVEFIKGIVQLLLCREEHTQSVMPHNLVQHRILHVRHIRIIGHYNRHLVRTSIIAAFHTALPRTRQRSYLFLSPYNTHRRMQPLAKLSRPHCHRPRVSIIPFRPGTTIVPIGKIGFSHLKSAGTIYHVGLRQQRVISAVYKAFQPVYNLSLTRSIQVVGIVHILQIVGIRIRLETMSAKLHNKTIHLAVAVLICNIIRICRMIGYAYTHRVAEVLVEGSTQPIALQPEGLGNIVQKFVRSHTSLVHPFGNFLKTVSIFGFFAYLCTRIGYGLGTPAWTASLGGDTYSAAFVIFGHYYRSVIAASGIALIGDFYTIACPQFFLTPFFQLRLRETFLIGLDAAIGPQYQYL